MKELTFEQVEDVNGGFLPLILAGAAWGAYMGGKEVGADIIKGIENSQ